CAAALSLWWYGPSNVGSLAEMPIHASASTIPCVHSGRLRASSVSSMRSTKRPPDRRASAQLNSAVRAPPTWKNPVGDGAMRNRGTMEEVTLPIRVREGGFPDLRHSDDRQHSDAGQPARAAVRDRLRNWRRATERLVMSNVSLRRISVNI